jgi:hypothetical protein
VLDEVRDLLATHPAWHRPRVALPYITVCIRSTLG